MKKHFVATAALFGFLALTDTAIAADPVVESDQAYFHLDGTYVLEDGGSGIQDGFTPVEVFQGDGIWIGGYAGYTTSSGWDWRVGADFADLSAGETNGAGGANDYGIDDSKMLSLNASVGHVFDLGGPIVRPFIGVQYLEWKQDHGLHPAVPFDCCDMTSKFKGFGPTAGFDAGFPVTEMIDLVGGGNVSVLFGEIDYTGGTQMVVSTGADNRSAFVAGGYAGLDIAVTHNISLGARYRLMYLDGTTYDNQQWTNTGIPTGKASNLLHGPSASLTIGF